MSYPRMKEVIKQLHRRTMEGDLPWEETEEEGVYQAAFPNSSVRLSERPAKNPDEPGMDYWVTIHNADGKLIDKVSDPDMRHDFEAEGVDSYDLLRELYNHARRTAMGVQDALSDILQRLGGTTAQQEDPGDSQ